MSSYSPSSSLAAATAQPPPSTRSPRLRSKKTAVELFDDWLEATESRDAADVLGLLSSNITEGCTVEDLEQFFQRSRNTFTYPEMRVKDVFVAARDPDRAFMTMELAGEPQPGEQGVRDAYLAAIPYPIIREDGLWRMLLQFPVVGEGCLFVGSSSRVTPAPADSATPSP